MRATQNNGKPLSLIAGFPVSTRRLAPSIEINLSYLSPIENPDVIAQAVTKIARSNWGARPC